MKPEKKYDAAIRHSFRSSTKNISNVDLETTTTKKKHESVYF